MGFIVRGLVSRLPHTRPSIRWTAALSVLLTMALLGNLLLPAVGFGQQAGPADQPFGPVLFSIATAPTATTPTATTGDALPATVPPTLVLHAKLDTPQGPLYIASGAAADVTALTASGVVTATILDDNTAGDPQDPTTRAVYYFADATDPTAADTAITQAGPIAKVIYRDANVLLVRSTAATELALVETLAGSGVPVSLLSSAALAPESPAAPSPAPAASAAAQAAVPDPTVAALLPKLTEADLRALIDRLSGQVAVTVGGQTLSLNTRYTFAARVQDAERYVYEYYQNLGIPVSYSPWTYGSYSGQNVVAEVRGAVNPEKVLIVGGHLDDISQSPYTVAPGGDDNGTGTAATMLIAKLLKDYRPDVTVRFVHFTAEEQGHWGSIVYASGLRARGEQVIGFIDLDMFGYDGNKDRVVEIHTGSGPKSNAFGASFQERNTRYGLGLNFEQKTTTASRFSDHSSFWDQDYASFLIIENFFDDAIARDRNPWYHNTGDLPVRVDYDYTARIARVALATMFELGGYKDAGAPTPTPTATPTGQPTPTPTPTNTPTPTPTPDPGGCTNLLVNGDFEGSTGWSFGSTPFPARYVTSPVYSGARAVTLGIPTGNANRLAHSSAYQRITIPANAPSPVVLRYMERPGGAADGVDYREALLLNTSYGYLASLRRDRAAGNSQWVERSFDLTAYRGKTVVLYFNVYNDGKGQQMWNTIDRAQLGGCTKSQAALDANGAPIPAPAIDPTLAAWHVFLPSLAK